MKYRVSVLEDYIDISTAGTKVTDIDFIDPCSRLAFIFRAKMPSGIQATYLEHPTAMIEKIEIVDGSDVLGSLAGKQLAAQNFYDDKQTPVINHTIESNGYTYFVLDWDFGRYLYDPDLALDPEKFRNAQIKVTYDKTNLHASMQALYMMLHAYLFDERKVAPRGFLMRKEIKEWTPTASAHEYSDLPLDYPYRQCYLYGYGDGDEIRSTIEEFKLSEDQDKKIPIDVDMRYWIYDVFNRYPDVVEDLVAKETTTVQTCYVGPSFNLRVAGAAGDAEVAEFTGNDANRLKVSGSGASTGRNYRLSGQVYLHSIPILTHEMLDMADWYVPPAKGSLRLDTKAHSGADSNNRGKIHLEQLRSY